MVGTFLIGCAVLLLVVSCAGTSSEAPQEKEKGHTEATNKEQGRTAEATESEEARCDRTGTTKNPVPGSGGGVYTTNDLPSCPNGGLLLGTDESDRLAGREGDDEIRALGGKDLIFGGEGNDVIYAGPGDDAVMRGHCLAGPDDPGCDGDDVIYGGSGDEGTLDGGKGVDVLYGGDGRDFIVDDRDRQPDKLYCGKGKDTYLVADKKDFVSSSCEKKFNPTPPPSRSEAPQEDKGHTEATKKDQTRSPEATESEEEARCGGTRTTDPAQSASASATPSTTNDLPDCPKGGLLLGTDKPDKLDGEEGDDEIRGLGGSDYLKGGSGDDVLYGGDGADALWAGGGEDVIYGGDGNDTLQAEGGQRDKLYCGKGKDRYFADKIDYVDSSCEKKIVGAGA